MALPASLQNLAALFLKQRCPGCGGDRKRDEDLCGWCSMRIEPFHNDPPHPEVDDACVCTVHSATCYAGLPGELIRRLKFRGERYLAGTCAGIIVRFSPHIPGPDDHILPVPAARTTRRRRGYNQARLISRALARMTGSHNCDLLARRSGLSQVGLSPEERRKNVEGVFTLRKGREVPAQGHIWIIDDVATTYSTIWSAATPLLEAGARSVSGLTLAYRRLHHGSIV